MKYMPHAGITGDGQCLLHLRQGHVHRLVPELPQALLHLNCSIDFQLIKLQCFGLFSVT